MVLLCADNVRIPLQISIKEIIEIIFYKLLSRIITGGTISTYQFMVIKPIDCELLIALLRTTATAHCSTSVLTLSAGAGQQCHAPSPTLPAGGHTGLALPSCSWWSQVPTR